MFQKVAHLPRVSVILTFVQILALFVSLFICSRSLSITRSPLPLGSLVESYLGQAKTRSGVVP